MILSALLLKMVCEVKMVRLCDNDEFSYACAGRSAHQLVCVSRSRKTTKESAMELKDILSKDINLLYHFQGKEFDLVEIKKLGLPESTPKSEVYQWLMIFRNGELKKLSFLSMSADTRTFSEGKLDFDEDQGVFLDTNGSWPLIRKSI